MRSLRSIPLFVLLALGRGSAAQPCPAQSLLAVTCENGRCDRLLGETAQNCPGDCLDTDTHVLPYYSLAASCPETAIFRPSDLTEARAAMRLTVAQGRHVRVVGTVHTGSSAVCSEHGNVLSTERLSAILGLETYAGQSVVHVQAGAHIWDVAELLHSNGKSLGFPIPGYGDLTVAGFLAVGGHGSDTRGLATLATSVVSIEKMDPLGQVTTYDAANTSPDLWRALRVDLGLLGMTVAVRLRVREQFHVRQRLLDLPESDVFQPGGMQALASGCQFLFVTYFHSVGRVSATCGEETADPVTAEDARMTLFTPPFPQIFKDLAPVVFQRAACDPTAALRGEKIFYSFRKAHPWLEWTDAQGKAHRGSEAVGYAHNMIETTFRGVKQPHFSNQDWEVAIPAAEIDAALQYVKSKLDEHRLYNPAIGVVIRADRASADTLLASSAAGADVAEGEPLYYLEFPIFWPYDFSKEQLEAYFAPYAEMIQHLITSHRARPHWGKNRNEIFSDPDTLASDADRRARFQPFVDQFDPYGVFANGFFRAAGFSWPKDGQDWVPEYFPSWAGRRLTLQNQQSGRCLQSLPGRRAETRPCDGSEAQRFFLFKDGNVFDPQTGELVDPAASPQAGISYAIRSAGSFNQCLDKLFGRGIRAGACENGGDIGAAELWTFDPAGGGAFKLKTLARDPAPCIKAAAGSASVLGTACSDAGQSAAERGRKRWIASGL
jgi:FAD binding domain-containing protein/D-arabinono-1,4-lactone oxidase